MHGTKAILGALAVTAWLASAAQAAGVEGNVFAADSTTAVANATVILSAPGTGGGARTPLDTAQTDAQGKFAFTGIAVGDNYGVAISATGFRPYSNNNLDLAADTTIASLRVILAVMPPPAAISGTVVGADTVTPVANASVILTRAGTGGGARTPVDTMITDALGKFSFPALAAADNYGLNVTATGFDPYTNNNVDLVGLDTSLLIRITPTPPPAAISGTVVGADTVTPVANASVILTRAGTGGGGARTPVDTVLTDALGKFSFPALAAANNYGLNVTATGFDPYTNNNIDLAGRDTSLLIRITPPPPPAAISGTVVAADTVTPVANATVVLSRAGTGGGGARTPVDTLQTDALGKFSFPALAPADNYGLTVTATGFQAYNNNNIDLEGRDTSLTIRLTPPPAPGEIRGTVFGADSTTAVANAMVILNRPGTGGGGARVAVDTMQTDAQGKFAFPGVGALQNYGLVVVAAGFQPYTNNNVDINGGDTATVNVRLMTPGTPGTIAGTVRGPGGANAAPIPNASVVLRSPALLGGLPLDTVLTDTAGRYSFPSVPSMDNYQLTVSMSGYNTANNNNVDVDSADTATVNFTLTTVSLFRVAQDLGVSLNWMNDGLAIRFPAQAAPYRLTAYAPDGTQRYQASIPAKGGLVSVPAEVIRQPGTMLILSGNGKRTHLRLPAR